MKSKRDTSRATILVIIGITGDLARRKLLPAIETIAAAGELPEEFRIVGVSRRNVSVKNVLSIDAGQYRFILKHLEIFTMNLEQNESYARLRTHLDELGKTLKSKNVQYLFYLSVPPQISRPIIEHLGRVGFGKLEHTKLLLEKPFGSDYQSALELIEEVRQYFDEKQIYRIDHYLAKEMAQNILVFRSGNSLFRRTWNSEFIERIDITASEKIDIEGRAAFYEQTGALRDVVQSHLLQLAALTLMGLPESSDLRNVPKKRLEILQSLYIKPSTSGKLATRGQYVEYRSEVNNPHSETETFVSLTLGSRDPRWKDVPVTLTTGKALDRKFTEVRLHYRQANAAEANQLVLRIQPEEGIEVDLWSKRPGYKRDLSVVRLNFAYQQSDAALPEAYEQVFLDAINSEHLLFISSDEILASWKILEPLQLQWEKGTNDLIYYQRRVTVQKIIKNKAGKQQ